MGRQIESPSFIGKNNGKSYPESEECPSRLLELLIKDGASTPLGSAQDPGLPPWFDYQKFTRGQQYFYNNFYCLMVSKFCGLITILAVPSILQVLMLTNQSTVPVTAFKRYVATLTHMLRWYEGDLLEPTSSAHKSLMMVRSRHCSASIRAKQSGFGQISQLDMVLTQFGFMGFAIVAPYKLGLTGTSEDVEGFIHFWRTVGYLIGIEDRFNLCRENVSDTRLFCQNILDQIFVPALQKPPKGFTDMVHSLIDGMWSMIPYLDYTAFCGFINYLAGIQNYRSSKSYGNYKKHKSFLKMVAYFYSNVLYALQIFVHTVVFNIPLLSFIVRTWMNYQLWLTVLLTQKYPILAFARFGRMEVESPMTYH